MAEYIEREAVLEFVEPDARPFLAERIKSIPAADVRPVVRAHWYWDTDGMAWNIGAWRCSACKAMSPMWWNADRGSPSHKSGHRFCPNCGAQMEES